jgi:hypothetical protein
VGGLVVALIAGFALGKAISPGGTPTSANAANPAAVPSHAHSGPVTSATGPGVGTEVGGLAIAAAGYTLVPTRTAYQVGEQTLRFVITGPGGTPVTEFATVHEKPLHLVLTRRDLTGYQHLHPTMAPDGTWTVTTRLPATGVWRAVADFTAIGSDGTATAATLGTDLTVSGDYQPATLPAPARETTVDGYTVTYEGTPRLGTTSPLLLRVYKDGTPVQGLDRYLGSYGHLVVFRQLDVAYVHTHPEEQLSGGAVKFWTAVPSTGTYRMFFDFQVDGAVHTASFTLTVTSG